VARFDEQEKYFTSMIQPLRKKHLVIWICIAIILLVAVTAAYFGSLSISNFY
jgi:hypothetical protein